jgi:hypothetical protein
LNRAIEIASVRARVSDAEPLVALDPSRKIGLNGRLQGRVLLVGSRVKPNHGL